MAFSKADMTDKPLPPFHNDFQCCVHGITYDFENHVGKVHMKDGNCTDRDGAISFFKHIDPAVVTISTFSGEKPDTVYFVQNGDWHEMDGKAA